MRKVIVYMAFALVVMSLAGVDNASGQHYIGVRGGVGSGSGRFDPKAEMGSLWGLYSGGVSWKYYSKERVLGGVEVDLMVMQQAYKVFYMTTPTNDKEKAKKEGHYQRTINTVMVPIAWQPHVYLFQRKLRAFLNLAVTFSYNISSREKNVDNSPGLINGGNYERKYTMKLTRDNPLGYGLFGGGGVNWAFGRIEVLGEVRYYFGLGDILRHTDKYEHNPRRSPLDGLQVQFGVYYRLGKGGILSPAGRKLKQKIEENSPVVVEP